MTIPTFALFENARTHRDWLRHNCDRCIKRYDPKLHPKGKSDCVMENAIALAGATDGTLLHNGATPINKANAIARRLGWDGTGWLTHECQEFVA